MNRLGASYSCGARRPMQAADWTDDGSTRERRQLKHRAEGDSRIVPVHPELTRLLARARRRSAPPRMAASSAAFAVASCPRSPTGARGSKRARRRSRRRSKPLPWPGGPTTSATHVCPHGSTAASTRPRSPNGPGTASTCYCGSTPSASSARTSWPSAGSPRRCARTELGHVLGTATCIWPPVAAHSSHERCEQDHDSPTYLQVRCPRTRTFKQWGGWGSNPRPADYESAALTG